MAERNDGRPEGGVFKQLHLDHLTTAGRELANALADRAKGSLGGKVESLTDRLTAVGDNGGSGLVSAITGKTSKDGASRGLSGAAELAEKAKDTLGGGKRGEERSNAKVVNIVEELDIGLPLRSVYDQWTRFEEYPGFTRKVQDVEQESDEKINWRARILWSDRSWESTIVDQVPDDRIVWRSSGAKGYVDGAVTFHELAPSMTRVLLVLEYHPDGVLEKTANLWRAQGRRVRSDLKHIKRHMMTNTILDQEDEIEGWRGEIRDCQVVLSHEDAVREEEDRLDEADADEGRSASSSERTAGTEGERAVGSRG